MMSELESASRLISGWEKKAANDAEEISESVLASIKPSPDRFSIHTVTPNEIKVNLHNRLGEALGLDIANMDDDFTQEILDAAQTLQQPPDGDARILEISKDLHLDDLSLTFEDLIKGFGAQDSESISIIDEKIKHWLSSIEQALRDQSEISRETNSPVILDDVGVYAVR